MSVSVREPKATASRRRPPTRITLRGEGESELERNVRKLARNYGWCGFHISFSKGAVTGIHMVGLGDRHYDSDGFPDWLFVRERVIYRELKGKGKYPTEAQKRWIAKLQAAGQDAKVWWPKDMDEIVATFSAAGNLRPST